MFGNREQMRRVFIEAWRKRREGLPLEPLEALIAGIVAEHPEYHPLFDDPDRALARDWSPEQGEGNPFLHLGMHVGLQEQLQTDRPTGIRDLYRRLALQTGDPHETEHQLMECLGRMLWEAQRANRMPDEADYLGCVRGLLRGGSGKG